MINVLLFSPRGGMIKAKIAADMWQIKSLIGCDKPAVKVFDAKGMKNIRMYSSDSATICTKYDKTHKFLKSLTERDIKNIVNYLSK